MSLTIVIVIRAFPFKKLGVGMSAFNFLDHAPIILGMPSGINSLILVESQKYLHHSPMETDSFLLGGGGELAMRFSLIFSDY